MLNHLLLFILAFPNNMRIDTIRNLGVTFVCWKKGFVVDVGYATKFAIELYIWSFPIFKHRVMYCIYGAPDIAS